VSTLERLAAVGLVAVLFVGLACPCGAADPKKEPAKSQPQKTQPAAKPSGGSAQQAATINAQRPTNTGNSTKPNEQMKSTASMGWDTKATDKGVVKMPATKPADPKVLAQKGNEQIKQGEHERSKNYPALGKPVPSPTIQKPAKSESVSFFSRLFGSKK
jgi:hypothetical protein